ncbi:MAG: hypothetical protein JWN34_5835 [Bryobacterales bacterium]|nr:hypothetical protein [Bryobacterales bacterium]
MEPRRTLPGCSESSGSISISASPAPDCQPILARGRPRWVTRNVKEEAAVARRSCRSFLSAVLSRANRTTRRFGNEADVLIDFLALQANTCHCISAPERLFRSKHSAKVPFREWPGPARLRRLIRRFALKHSDRARGRHVVRMATSNSGGANASCSISIGRAEASRTLPARSVGNESGTGVVQRALLLEFRLTKKTAKWDQVTVAPQCGVLLSQSGRCTRFG